MVTGTGSAADAGGRCSTPRDHVTLNGASFVEVSRARAHPPAAAPLTTLSGGALNLGTGTGFLVSSTGPSTIGGSLLRTTGAAVTTTGNLVTVSGSLTDTGAAPLLDLTGGAVSARNGLALSSASGQLSLNGPALARSGGTLAVTDDLLNISAGGRLTSAGTGALLGFSGATVNVGNGSGDQLFQLTGAGSTATLAAGVLDASNTAFTLTGSSLVDVSTAGPDRERRRPASPAVRMLACARATATGFAFQLDRRQPDRGQPAAHHRYQRDHHRDLVPVTGTLTDTGAARCSI